MTRMSFPVWFRSFGALFEATQGSHIVGGRGISLLAEGGTAELSPPLRSLLRAAQPYSNRAVVGCVKFVVLAVGINGMVTGVAMPIRSVHRPFSPFSISRAPIQSFDNDQDSVVYMRGYLTVPLGLRSPSLAGVSEPGCSKAAKAEQLAQRCL